jgi:hypothetical protein
VPFVGEGVLLALRELVICVGRDGHRRGGAAETVPNAAVVLRSTDQNADRFVVIVAAEYIVDEGDIEVEFAGIMSSCS